MEKLTYKIDHRDNPDEYVFTTKAGITYACFFVEAQEIFKEYPDVSSSIYLFNLDVRSGDISLQGPDKIIGMTVGFIVEDFILQNEFAVVYVCDASDRRELFRNRKFDDWFIKSNTTKIVKIDSHVKTADFLVLNTLLIIKDHPLRDRIISVFLAINKELDDKPADQ